MAGNGLARQMREAAQALIGLLDPDQRELAELPFGDEAARRWLEYRPNRRPGASVAVMSPDARKAAHQLLCTALSDRGYAQAMAIIALEEVLDRFEQGQRGRHSGDYWVCVFGTPGSGEPWSWRFEGHHLSVSMTVLDDEVSPAPVFMGANPACVSYGGRAVSRPLAPEEDLGRALVHELGPAGRRVAVVSDQAPGDIRTSVQPDAGQALQPLGIPADRLGPTARALLDQLVAVYLDRLPAELARREAARIAAGELHFAWEGPITPGTQHYYRVQGDDLLIEYDNTDDDGNHAHTVLRRPRSDFGSDILALHRQAAHTALPHQAAESWPSAAAAGRMRGPGEIIGRGFHR